MLLFLLLADPANTFTVDGVVYCNNGHGVAPETKIGADGCAKLADHLPYREYALQSGGHMLPCTSSQANAGTKVGDSEIYKILSAENKLETFCSNSLKLFAHGGNYYCLNGYEPITPGNIISGCRTITKLTAIGGYTQAAGGIMSLCPSSVVEAADAAEVADKIYVATAQPLAFCRKSLNDFQYKDAIYCKSGYEAENALALAVSGCGDPQSDASFKLHDSATGGHMLACSGLDTAGSTPIGSTGVTALVDDSFCVEIDNAFSYNGEVYCNDGFKATQSGKPFQGCTDMGDDATTPYAVNNGGWMAPCTADTRKNYIRDTTYYANTAGDMFCNNDLNTFEHGSALYCLSGYTKIGDDISLRGCTAMQGSSEIPYENDVGNDMDLCTDSTTGTPVDEYPNIRYTGADLTLAFCIVSRNTFKVDTIYFCNSGYTVITPGFVQRGCKPMSGAFAVHTAADGGNMLPCSGAMGTVSGFVRVSGTNYYRNPDSTQFCDKALNKKNVNFFPIRESDTDSPIIDYQVFCSPGAALNLNGIDYASAQRYFDCEDELTTNKPVDADGACVEPDYSAGQGHCVPVCPEQAGAPVVDDPPYVATSNPYYFMQYVSHDSYKVCRKCFTGRPMANKLRCEAVADSIAGCAYYSDESGECAECQPGMYFLAGSKTCSNTLSTVDDVTRKACVVYNTTTTCALCDAEHILSGSGNCIDAETLHCARTDGKVCVECLSAFQWTEITDDLFSCTHTECLPGEFAVSEDDGEVVQTHCEACNPNTLCEITADNFLGCVDGYYISPLNTCETCDTPDCKKCVPDSTKTSICVECNAGLYLVKGACKDESAMEAAFPGCTEFDVDDLTGEYFCIKCDTDADYFLHARACYIITDCAGNYHLDDAGDVRCHCPNGIDVDGKASASTDALAKDAITKCEFCRAGCLECVREHEETAPRTAICKPQTAPAPSCAPGYVYVSGEHHCALAVDKCVSYEENNWVESAPPAKTVTGKCTVCSAGTYPNDEGTECKKCMDNCQECELNAARNGPSCTLPEAHYFLTGAEGAWAVAECDASCNNCVGTADNCEVTLLTEDKERVLIARDPPGEAQPFVSAKYYDCADGYAKKIYADGESGALCGPIDAPGSLIDYCARATAYKSNPVCLECGRRTEAPADTNARFLHGNKCEYIAGCREYTVVSIGTNTNYDAAHPVQCNCPVGTYLNADRNACERCPKGCYHCALRADGPRSIEFAYSDQKDAEEIEDSITDATKVLTHCLSSKCAPGYQFQAKSELCLKAPQNCYYDPQAFPLKCEEDTCHPGYFYDVNECKACSAGCKTCTGAGATECTSCFANYDLVDTNSCKVKCAVGQYLDGAICRMCKYGCTECTGADTCTACRDGYYNNAGVCTKCGTGCKKCDLTGMCDEGQCADGYYVVETTDTSHIVTARECRKLREGCTKGEGDNACAPTVDGDCTEGYTYTDPPSNRCVKNCAPGYFNLLDHMCQKCQPLPHCATCASLTECATCETNYELNAEKRCVLTSATRLEALSTLRGEKADSALVIAVVGAGAFAAAVLGALLWLRK